MQIISTGMLVQEMNEGVATLTNDGTIFYGNEQLASMLQFPLEKIMGKRLNDFIITKGYRNISILFLIKD